jgi:mannosyltransferase PIG-V
VTLNHPAQGQGGASPLLGLAVILIASRAILIIIALGVEGMYGMQEGGSASTAPLLRSLTASDAEAVSGPYHDYAFFPLYPALVRLLSVVTGDVVIAGVILANVAFALAAILLEQMGRPILGPRGSLLGVAFVALAPGAVAFSMAYPESLFLLLTLGAVAAGLGARWALMSALFALACLTRLPGIVLLVPLAIAIGQRVGWRWHRHWLWLLSGPVALSSYLAFLWWLTGDPLAYPRAQAAWNEPIDTLGPPGLPAIPPTAILLLLISVVGFYLFQVIYFRTSRVPAAHLAYAIASVVFLLLTLRIVSTPRWLAVLWPFAWVMVSRRSRLFIGSSLAAFTATYAAFAFLNFTTLLAP